MTYPAQVRDMLLPQVRAGIKHKVGVSSILLWGLWTILPWLVQLVLELLINLHKEQLIHLNHSDPLTMLSDTPTAVMMPETIQAINEPQ